MEAAVTESRTRRRGTVVQTLRAVAGSSEVAIVAAAPPVQRAVAATASLGRERQRDRTTMFFSFWKTANGQASENNALMFSFSFFFFSYF